MDLGNNHAVGIQGEMIGMLIPPSGLMSKNEALILAAWLVCLADPLGKKFGSILHEVQNT